MSDMNECEAVRVGSVAELRQGKPLGVNVAGHDIAIFEVAGGIVATAGKCLHAGGPLCQGSLEAAILTCPWHGWSYDLKTGICEEDPALVLQRYVVTVQGDDILVEL